MKKSVLTFIPLFLLPTWACHAGMPFENRSLHDLLSASQKSPFVCEALTPRAGSAFRNGMSDHAGLDVEGKIDALLQRFDHDATEPSFFAQRDAIWELSKLASNGSSPALHALKSLKRELSRGHVLRTLIRTRLKTIEPLLKKKPLPENDGIYALMRSASVDTWLEWFGMLMTSSQKPDKWRIAAHELVANRHLFSPGFRWDDFHARFLRGKIQLKDFERVRGLLAERLALAA